MNSTKKEQQKLANSIWKWYHGEYPKWDVSNDFYRLAGHILKQYKRKIKRTPTKSREG